MNAPSPAPTRRPLRTRLSVQLVVGLLAIAAVGAACQQSAGTLPDAGSPAAQLYIANCASCHGADAGGLSGPTLRTGLKAADVDRIITQGVGGRMPSFKGRLSPEEITELAAYIERIGDPGTPESDDTSGDMNGDMSGDSPTSDDPAGG
jgi:mono/diheme cytochrome c family protein